MSLPDLIYLIPTVIDLNDYYFLHFTVLSSIESNQWPKNGDDNITVRRDLFARSLFYSSALFYGWNGERFSILLAFSLQLLLCMHPRTTRNSRTAPHAISHVQPIQISFATHFFLSIPSESRHSIISAA